MGGLSLGSTMAVLLLLLLPLAHGYYHHGRTVHGYGKRDAEPFHGHGYLVAAYHPAHHAVGYGVHHHGYGKRSPTHNKRPKRPKRPKAPKNRYRPRYYYYRG